MNKYFCNAPFDQLEITPDGMCRICCKMPSVMVMDKNNTQFRVHETTVTNIWESEWLKNFRQRFIEEEKRPECQMCWDDEAAGIKSLRQQLDWKKVNIEEPRITELVLKLSNKCNCACRICCFWLSSLWQSELEKTDRWDPINNHFARGNSAEKLNENWEDWKKHLHNLERLLLYGGEPLINYEVLKILDYLVEEGLAKNITLILNTNGSVINDKIINIFKQFKLVYLYFSIDDVFERYEYERWPMKHENVFRDLKAFHDVYERENINVTLYGTVSIFNVLYLQEILDEFEKFSKFKINFSNLIHDPKYLSIYNLPEIIKPQIAEVLTKVNYKRNWEYEDLDDNILISFMNLYKSKYTCTSYIEELDKKLGFDDLRRKQDWKKTFSKLYNLLIQGSKSEQENNDSRR